MKGVQARLAMTRSSATCANFNICLHHYSTLVLRHSRTKRAKYSADCYHYCLYKPYCQEQIERKLIRKNRTEKLRDSVKGLETISLFPWRGQGQSLRVD